MKSQLKSARRSSKTAAAPQSKTAQRKTRIASVRIVTYVWYLADGSEWARVELPWALFVLIKSTARKLNITLEQFFDNAVRNYIELRAHRRAA